MTDKTDNPDVMFYQLVLSLQASAMQQLGKVMSPITGKVERNLEAARYSVDLLEMLQRKTTGNLSDDEKKLLDHVLYELRLNYVEEAGKGETAEQTDSASEKPSGDKAESSDQDSDRSDTAAPAEDGSD